ncbi:hypothetical protein [Caldovatus aquaticus]|uniref:Uncharacterized protein n=1 Tax=Caldovatus aquaticus TaxID=2865671 RepID=A0ABS7F3M6_9PROT|nr:hypothetical protein [Caldovatus aquaticus]MBW8270179.1 hypothetical protein [Caldovatus aquaticus]
MISLNSLAAFTAEVTRTAGLQPARGAGAAAGMGPREAPGGPALASAPPQRVLETVPPQPPARPPPRGSLLDLRV